jgi:DNA-binding MarR family transcriptional regulator
MSTSLTTAQELLAVLPLFNRIMAVELRQESDDETTMPQFRVLGYLAEEPMTMSAIARRRHVSFQSAGELVQALVERGWVVRMPDPSDRRQSLLQLTEAGLARYEQAQHHMLERLASFMDQLDEDEKTTIQQALQSLHRVLVQEVVDEK